MFITPEVPSATFLETTEPEDDWPIPLSELWNAISTSHLQKINGTRDLFQELQDVLASGEVLFSMPVSPLNASLSNDIACDAESDFGIELSGVNFQHFLTAVLFSSPRLPFSQLQKQAILCWAQQLGACDVPSLHALQRCYEEMKKMVGDPTDKVTSPLGNVFYINDIAKAIRKDGGNTMSQVFNGEKMLHEMLSPPAIHIHRSVYFIGELLQESSGMYFIPKCFFLATPGIFTSTSASSTKQTPSSCVKELFALGCSAACTDAGFIVNDEKEIISTSMFKRLYEDILFHPSELACSLMESSKKYASLEPNSWCKKLGSHMVYAVPLIIFMDDISGNISKQWNKHFVVYMSNANLWCEMLDRKFCVQFVTSSPHASPMELMHAMKQSVSYASASGIITWDCWDQEEVMLAEECSQGGLNCNYYCQTCHAGGPKEHKGSEAGYCSLFKPGILRTPGGTLNEIKNQFGFVVLSGASTKIQASVSSTGVHDSLSLGPGNRVLQEIEIKAMLEKELTELLGGKGLDDVINLLLGMEGINVHMDTPMEILHTILLGIVKYFCGQTIAKLLDLFQSCLDSIEHDMLNAPNLNLDYICCYKGALIRKHFKSLMQVMPFIIHDLVPQMVIDGWTSMGELVVLLWHMKIKDVEAYLAWLSRTIEDFLNVTAICAPSILITKPKFHFLVHLPTYICHFGPAIIFSMERYESFNHFDIIKHIVTGGCWYEKNLQKWVHAGPFVLSFLSEHPTQAHLLGITLDNIIDSSMLDGLYFQGDALIARHGDKVKLNGNVIFTHAASSLGFSVGQVVEIVISDAYHCIIKHVAIQLFKFKPALHPSLHLPKLCLTDQILGISCMDIVCAVNLQHNCMDSKCITLVHCAAQQERVLTAQTKSIIHHEETPNYFLNTFSIHNYAFIHAALPAFLQETPLHVAAENVQKVHSQAAQQIWQKRAQRTSSRTPVQDSDVPTLASPAFDRQSKQRQKCMKITVLSALSNLINSPAQSLHAELTPLIATVPQNPHPSQSPHDRTIPLSGSNDSCINRMSWTSELYSAYPVLHYATNSPPPPLMYNNSSSGSWSQTIASYSPPAPSKTLDQHNINIIQTSFPHAPHSSSQSWQQPYHLP
ncbi:hypothetical protein EDC04DRAFT_2873238 [Pisolithus marmoratus]|nr:hypothetical protein EDC04DRAFT_2873238 [Pisolithus marmoratus]